MFLTVLGLVISLVLILVSCELFTNSIEWLGKELRVGDGVVGSLLSAVGTCLPETMIPIIPHWPFLSQAFRLSCFLR